MKINLLLILSITSLLLSCNGSNKDNEVLESDSLLRVTVHQFRAMNMEIGGVTRLSLANTVAVQGIIEPSPNAKAYITSPVGGFIKSIRVSPSAMISKGQVVIVIDGPEVMGAQTAFVEIYHQHNMAKASYERFAQLSQNGIASQKELIQAESEFRILESKLHSQMVLIRKLGLNPDMVLNGEISSEAYLSSPIDGVVSSVEATIGRPVSIDQPVAEVINPNSLLLKFYVFLDQVGAIKPGQRVEIDLPGVTGTLIGEVFSVGLDANTENKAVACFASIKYSSNVLLVSGMRVPAKVTVGFTNGWFLPKSAIHYREEKPFVYIVSDVDSIGYNLKISPLRVGLVQDSLVQVFDSTLLNVLIRGGYELNVE